MMNKYAVKTPDGIAQSFAATPPSSSAPWPDTIPAGQTVVDVVGGLAVLGDAPDPVIEWREEAFLPKAEFAVRCYQAGVFTSIEDVRQARNHEIPASLLALLPESMHAAAEEAWALANYIRRMDPMVEEMRLAMDMDPSEADGLFGWG